MFSRPSVVGTLALSLAVMSEAGGAGAGFARGASALRSSTSNADGARSRPGAGPAFVPQPLNFALRKTNGVMQRATCTKQGMADRKEAIQIVDGDDGAEVETNPSSGAQLVTYGDVFRAALSDVEERELREEEARRIDVVTPVKNAASTVGSGVVSVLERIFSGGKNDEDEVSKSLREFALRHPGAVGLPVVSKTFKTDLDRFEEALELELSECDSDESAEEKLDAADDDVLRLDKDDFL